MQRHSNWHWNLARFGWVVCLCLVAGCHLIHKSAHWEPFPHQLARGQLVIHSDFPLSKDDRLIAELVEQRERISNKLLVPISDQTINVYLYGSEEEYQNYIQLRFPDFAERRAIFVQTAGDLAVFAFWGEHTADDLRHEVAHGYLNASIKNLPLWLDEGLAEYFEVGPGRGGFNKPHVELLTSQIDLHGWRPQLARLEALDSPAEMTQQDYAEAWAWVHFLLEGSDEQRSLLPSYLANLRATDHASPLSTRLRQHLAQPEQALLDHVNSLR